MKLDRPVDRRGFLLLGSAALVLASGCTSTGSAVAPTASSPQRSRHQTTPSTSPDTTTVTTPVGADLPAVTRWQPNAGDVSPGVKAQAVRVIEAIGTWPAGESGASAAATRLHATGASGSLLTQGQPLLSSAPAAVLQVVEAQYGGILSTTSSVLVVCRQWLAAADGSVKAGGTTVDVRLSAAEPHWTVTALNPARPGPPLSSPSSLARQVLANPRLDLPPAAVADVLSGNVHDTVLMAMLRLAQTYRIGVSVVRSGHPIYVFGTTRLSDHPRGRAFDTFRINGHLVVDPATPRDLVTGYMEAAREAGSYNVGGPYLLSGEGNQFFSDATHHDHVHAGFAT